MCDLIEDFVLNKHGEKIPLIVNPKIFNKEEQTQQIVNIFSFIDYSNSRSLNKLVLKNSIKSRFYKNKKTGLSIIISNNSLLKMLNTAILQTNFDVKNNFIKKEDTAYYNALRFNLICNIGVIFENSFYILKHTELKKNCLNRNIFRYSAAVCINDTIFYCLLTLKEDTQGLKFFANLYDLKSNKKGLAVSRSENSETPKLNLSYSIPDLLAFVKLELAKYATYDLI